LAAVRAGNVLVANALGSGVIESAGLLGFLPKICQHLLGEPLKIPFSSNMVVWRNTRFRKSHSLI
jgi:uncharacterized circularly permuted ATP-grasp superfamily protein